MTERYTLLANTEALDKTIDEVTKRQIQAERTTIFYWFHARGWPIDEDAESRGFFHRWSELISYWKS